MCRVVLAIRKRVQGSTKNLLQQRFLVHGREGKTSRVKFCACVERQKILQKILERKVGLVVQGQKETQQKLYQVEEETEAKKREKRNRDYFSRDQSRI